MKRIAHNYRRFSSGKQAKGSTLDRQEEFALSLCAKNGWQLSEIVIDAGKSGWKGKNAATGNLKGFLDAIQSGKVRPGEILIIENLDRLSRDEILPALNLFSSILSAGVDIATANPERIYTKRT